MRPKQNNTKINPFNSLHADIIHESIKYILLYLKNLKIITILRNKEVVE